MRLKKRATRARFNYISNNQFFAKNLALRKWRHITVRFANEELARPADLLLGIRNHLVPLRDPADCARHGENTGKQRHRNSQRRLHDAGPK